nr:PREDICTED: DNA (cytosine-5)-methyltransferase 3B-like isoform X1 [Bemisia tabaci]XP_018899089.1 PREDICTED: DNA (cytosine-5)-methyltransferase 3B-like isoform X1 [Bemisia tabaci]XP_018899090.1 PREDICTED: DNA (cytosine-5)-methyltransferase 3B-like isoform X1 [Bemisia tabaci]XP_018899091.1 PREDICTED: DNA (cytosine-5)-methyltransferase 3B-like isoform X1 [Bemisia tabaci]XP_018899092.1 PREDICTED: DNA (cytosine-5)-methyltransferase 3B-like isoform X1 [Bemisia tabaci]
MKDEPSDVAKFPSTNHEFSGKPCTTMGRKARTITTSSNPKALKWGSNVPLGLLVWGKVSSSPWWPGIVVNHEDCGVNPPAVSSVWVFWFGDYRVSEVPLSRLQPFAESFVKLFDKNNKGVRLKNGVLEAIKIHAARSGETDSELWNFSDAVSWISSIPLHMLKSKHISSSDSFDDDLPEFVNSKILKIKLTNLELTRAENKRKSEESDDDDEICKFNKKLKASQDKVDASREVAFKSSVIEKVKGKKLKLENICLCCVREKSNLNHEHPFFEGRVCDQCFEEIKDTAFVIGDDNVYYHCVVCAQRGEVLICDNPSCKKVYCNTCIEVLCPKKARERIAEMNPWLCFLCSGYDKQLNGFLKKRENFSAHVAKMYIEHPKPEIIPKFERHPLRVLSLFDGIGTGLCVLKKLKLKVEVYYASEIEDDAINVTTMNHGSDVIHLGKVEDLTNAELAKLGPIDLLIGGSPCNELSGVNHARKGIYDATGTGVLFFDFFRILQFLKTNNDCRHLFWLFENVTSMPKDYRKVITRFFECDPIVVDAKYFSAQNRSRFFWGNIPSLRKAQESAMDIENCPELNSVLTKNCSRKAVVKKVCTITTNPNSLRQGKEASMPVLMNGKGDTLWATEMEELFGFPRHYTDAGNLQPSRRLRLLGKSWSIPVLCHILKPLTMLYPSTEAEIA